MKHLTTPRRRRPRTATSYLPYCELLEPRALPAVVLDPTFGTHGTTANAVPNTEIIQGFVVPAPGGKVVVAGTGFGPATSPFTRPSSFFVERLNADGSLDTNFGTGGVVQGSFGSETTTGLAVQPDGKVLVGLGSGKLQRYTVGGTLDASFGSGGTVTPPWAPTAVVLQPDGKILVPGQAGELLRPDFGTARLDASGQLDPTFGNGGTVITDLSPDPTTVSSTDTPYGVVVQADGKIVVTGRAYTAPLSNVSDVSPAHPATVRYTATGQLDPTWNGNGILVDSSSVIQRFRPTQMVQEADGKLVLAAPGTAANNELVDQGLVTRYTADGRVDATFGTAGKVVLAGRGSSRLAALPDQSFVVGFSSTFGLNNSGTNLSTYLVDGALDVATQADGTPLALRSSGGSVLVTRFAETAGLELLAGADAGGGPDVKVFDAVTRQALFNFFAFDPNFTGGARVAVGDVNGDGTPDIITGPGPGGGPQVRVFDGHAGAPLAGPLGAFFAFDPHFTGGVFVASGDVNGDGFADVIVSADAGGGPSVTTYSGKDGSVLGAFFAYDRQFTGGVRVAAGDVNGDGRQDIVCGAGPGGGPNVTVISGASNTRLASFFAYAQGFTAGIYVGAGDVNGDGRAEVITGAGAGGGPNVSVFDVMNNNLILSFFPYAQAFTGGVRVAGVTAGVGGNAALATVPGPGGGPDVRMANGVTGELLDEFFAYDPNFTGGLYVAGSSAGASATAGVSASRFVSSPWVTTDSSGAPVRGMAYYTSQNGVPNDASLSNPAVGTDGSAALQALIDHVYAAGGGTIVVDTATKCGNVRLHSGVTIQGLGGSWYGPTGPGGVPTTGLIQAANTLCIFRNDNWTSNYNGGNPVSDYSTITDQDITIRDLFLNGNRGSDGVNNACGGNGDTRYIVGNDGYSNASQLGIQPLMFFGVRSLQVQGVWIYDPAGRGFLGSYLDGFTLRDLTVIYPDIYGSRNNPGAIQVRNAANANPGTLSAQGGNVYGGVTLGGSVRNGRIENVSGYCEGALVAVQTDFIAGMTGAASYYPIWYPGPATDLQISALRANLASALVAVWSGQGAFSSLIDRLSVSGGSGTVFQAAVYIDGPAATVGTHGKESYSDISVDLDAGFYPTGLCYIEGNHADLTLRNFQATVQAATKVISNFAGSGLLWVNAPVGSIDIAGVEVHDSGTLNYDLVDVNGAAVQGIRDFQLSDVVFARTQSAACTVVHFGGATVATAALTNILADGVANIVLYDHGSLGSLTTAGLTHRNAGGNASIQVRTQTLPRLRASGSNTQLLTGTSSGGSIVDLKTDGTEGNASVYYTSAHGVPGDADLSNPAVGTDGSAALQALIDHVYAAGGGTIVVDTATKCGNVQLRSGITLQGLGGSWYGPTGPGGAPKAGLIQAPGTQCLFRNAHWTSRYHGGTPVNDFSTIVDQDIVIQDLFINGNRGTGSVNSASGGNGDIRVTGSGDGFANPGLLTISPLIFLGVRNLTVDNVFVYDPDVQAFFGAYLDGFQLRGITTVCPNVYIHLATPAAITNGASGSIAISGAARNGTIDSVGGFVGGNMVSLASDAFATTVSTSAAYYPILYPGPITNVQVSNVNPVLAAGVSSVWSGNTSTDNTQPSSLIDGILIHDVAGTYFGVNVIGFDGPSSVIGTHGDEQVYNMSLKIVQGPNHFRAPFAEGNHAHLAFRNISFDVSGITSWDPVSLPTRTLLWLNLGTSSPLVELDGITIYSTSPLAFDAAQLVGNSNPRVSISNVSVVRTRPAAGALIHCGGDGSTIEIQLSNVLVDGFANAILYDGGSLASITSVGLTHRNANGDASIFIGAGKTLARLRAAGSNTALLVAGPGSVTDKRTDGTEDA